MRRKLLIGLAAGLLVLLILPYLIPLPGGPGRPADDFAWPGGRFVTAQSVRTFVETAGPADGPPVVLVHGFGGSTFSWRYTLPALGAAGFRAVALDLKGFGLSDKRYDQDYSHPAQAAFVAAVMDELGIERASLAGHSMGGSVAAHFALQFPDRIDRLIFVDGALFEAGQARPPLGAVFDFPPARQWGRVLMRGLLTPERVSGSLRTAYADPAFVTPEIAAGYGVPQQVMGWDLALMGVVRDAGRNALPRPLSEISAPTLVAWGEQDTWVPLESGRRAAAQIPGAELVIFPGAGHLPMEEQAEAFNAALIDFLR